MAVVADLEDTAFHALQETSLKPLKLAVVRLNGVPLQHDDWTLWALCGVFAVVVTVQLWLFRRRGWFGG